MCLAQADAVCGGQGDGGHGELLSTELEGGVADQAPA
jgi:hypothetical protein